MSGSAARWRFAPGDWYAVLGEDLAVVLPPSERERVASLWELADAGAAADDLLDAVLAGGLSGLSDLALVSWTDGVTRVLVRGVATASVEGAAGTESVAADPGAVWSERIVPGGTAGRLDLGGNQPADREIAAGLVRVSVLEFGRPPHESEAASGAPTEFSLEAQPAPQPDPQPVLRAVPPEPAEPGHEPDETGDAAAVAAEGVDAEGARMDDAAADRDGQTAAGSAPAFDRPPVPGQEHAPPVVSAPVATLVFSTGDVVEVDRAVLVGRAPEARRFASHEQPRTVAVMSPNQEISSTHLEIRPGGGADHGSAIATDLGSTNGTVLVQPGLQPEDLQPGIAVSLIPGAVLDLGDGVIIQVTNPDARS